MWSWIIAGLGATEKKSFILWPGAPEVIEMISKATSLFGPTKYIYHRNWNGREREEQRWGAGERISVWQQTRPRGCDHRALKGKINWLPKVSQIHTWSHICCLHNTNYSRTLYATIIPLRSWPDSFFNYKLLFIIPSLSLASLISSEIINFGSDSPNTIHEISHDQPQLTYFFFIVKISSCIICLSPAANSSYLALLNVRE